MESAHNIDPATNLIGLTNIPDGSLISGLPCVILINAGFLHRVGPNRLNTDLARRLAKENFASLRMDLSGLGDSMSGPATLEDRQIISQDLDKAMEFMQKNYGLHKYILVGLCSGANDTAIKAIADERVVGLLNIDGVGYRTKRFYVNYVLQHLLRRAIQPERWKRLLNRFKEKSQSLEAKQAVRGPLLANNTAYTDWSCEQSGEYIQTLAQRGVLMHFIYTGGVTGYYNYRQQFWDMFSAYNLKGMASTSYFPATDHLNMLQHHRNEMQQDIIDWAKRSF
ncbi:MAG: hypothetical protein V3U65_14940 [Granulosicoccaceae bacterium]